MRGGDTGEWECRWREAARDEAALPADEDGQSDPPYRGLARFEAGDRDRFFGRDHLTDAVEELVRAHRCMMVFGPSGSGKSSLLRAGLIPRLQNAHEPGLRPAVIRILTPGSRPAHAHEKLFTPADAPDGMAGETWLVVDQFEELFTLCHDQAQRRGFIELVLGAQDPSSRLRVVLGARADFYARCLDQPGLDAIIREASLPVGRMTPTELREVIVKPAAAEGLIVERVLTAHLIEEVGEEPGALPLLSHVLLETWRRHRGRTLTMEAYEAAGGMHGAIAQTAEEIYTRLAPEHAELARLILLRLIAPGEGSPDTRRPVDRSELDLGTASRDDIALVLDRLAGARLLTLDEDTVDLAHCPGCTAGSRTPASSYAPTAA
ncbi:nSTAND1 domain-containing NTPase [Streptomyces sp. NPDC003006]